MVFGNGVSPSAAGSAAISAEEADIFDGQERIHTTLCWSPALVKHVTEQLKDESLIAKEARKAREEQALARQQGRVQAPEQTPGAFEVAAPNGPPAQHTPKKKKGGGRGNGGGQG